MKYILFLTFLTYSCANFNKTQNFIDQPENSMASSVLPSQFQKCYDDELKINSNVSGIVVLNWDISELGDVSAVSIQSTTLKNENIEKCMIETLKKMKFQPVPKGHIANISYPFTFKNKK